MDNVFVVCNGLYHNRVIDAIFSTREEAVLYVQQQEDDTVLTLGPHGPYSICDFAVYAKAEDAIVKQCGCPADEPARLGAGRNPAA